MPTLSEYICYNFSVCSIMVGPFIEFRTFDDWINLRGHFKDMPTLGQMPTFAKRFAVMVLTIATAAVLGSYINFDYMLTPEFAN